MYTYEKLLSVQVDRVKKAFSRQILDRSHPAFGAYVSQRTGAHPCADHTANASDLAGACFAYLADGSDVAGDQELLERIRYSIAFQRRWQRSTGLIDLVSINWESPPDTSFTVQLLSPVVQAARRQAEAGSAGAAEIAESLGEYVRTASQGIIGRGFHTPNHRWVVCSALAQAMALFPELPAREYVDEIVAETIDINADGEFTERSTGVYNAVCNRSLRFMADYLGRPELLEHVRRNLSLMSHLFHDDGTVVTFISNRQDRGERLVPVGIADSFFDMAQRDRNGAWAQIADMLVSRGSDAVHSPWLIQPFMDHPEYRTAHVERSAAPEDFSHHYSDSGIWRVKRGKLSATAATGNRTAFSLRFGQLELQSVKFSGTYMGTTNFSADEMTPVADGVRMVQRGRNRPAPGYNLPLGRPVPFGEFASMRQHRERWTLPEIDLILEIREVENGFELHYTTEGGVDRIPIEIECAFQPCGEWESADTIVRVTGPQSAILTAGFGTFHYDDEGISIGPGAGMHRDWSMRASEPDESSFRVLITLETPVDHTLQIRYGTWSLATGSLL